MFSCSLWEINNWTINCGHVNSLYWYSFSHFVMFTQPVSSKLASGVLSAGSKGEKKKPLSSSSIINGVSTSRSRHIFPCALNEPPAQLAPQWVEPPRLTGKPSARRVTPAHLPALLLFRLHLYGVCQARRGVLPSPAPAAHCGQVNGRDLLVAHTAINTHRCVASNDRWPLGILYSHFVIVYYCIFIVTVLLYINVYLLCYCTLLYIHCVTLVNFYCFILSDSAPKHHFLLCVGSNYCKQILKSWLEVMDATVEVLLEQR